MVAKKAGEKMEFVAGDKVKVKETGKEGVVVEVSYAGNDKTVPIYAVQLSETETRHYTGDQLELL